MYYYPLQPPYFLLILGFFVALTSGFALSGTLKLVVQNWQINSTENSQISSSFKKYLFLPFLGITSGICLFVSSGLEIFGFPFLLALGIGLPLSLSTCLLVWFQLNSMLTYAERRGMKSLDLDSLS